MSGLYHFVGDLNEVYANPTNSHNSANFTDPTGDITGYTDGNKNLNHNINVRQSGGGYGMAMNQTILRDAVPEIIKTDEIINASPSNLGASTHYTPSTPLPKPFMTGGKKKNKRPLYGGSSSIYYGFGNGNENENNGDLKTFIGSGYPPLTIGSQDTLAQQGLIGGRRTYKKGHKIHKSHKSHKAHKRTKISKKHRKHKGKHSRRKTSRLIRKLGIKKKMSSKLFKKLIGGNCSASSVLNQPQQGGYSQYLGDQAFTQGYEIGGQHLSPNNSSLANPPPFTPYNHCSDK
jgi:hypothetical protein